MIAFKKLIFWLHLSCGIAMGMVVFIMSFTGVVLTYEKQIASWADGFEVRPPAPGAQKLSPATILQRANAETGKLPTAIRVHSDPEEPTRVSFGRESYMVDPYSGDRFGDGAVELRGFFRTMIVWHRWLGSEGDGRAVGKAVTGACNLGFLFLIVTGSYLWWPKNWTWKHLRPVVFFQRGLSARARDFNWHNVFGLWLAIPLFLIVATATFFSYSWPMGLLRAVLDDPPTQQGQPGQGGGQGGSQDESAPQPPRFDDLDALFAKAEATEPEWQTITMQVHARPDGPVSFTLDRGNGFRPDLLSTLVLRRESGDVVMHQTYADVGRAQRTRRWIRWLHTGEAGGWAGQTLAGVASLAACFLVYTGWMLSWRRFQAWRKRTRNVG